MCQGETLFLVKHHETYQIGILFAIDAIDIYKHVFSCLCLIGQHGEFLWIIILHDMLPT